MSWKCDKVHERQLRAARSEEEYQLHQAALEWSLDDCIVIQTLEDVQSQVNWRDRLKPYHHQVQNLFTFCRRLPVTLLADDVGLGKTISAGLILSELMVRKRVSRALVVCPKILGPQWVEELAAKFGILGRSVVGKDLAREMAGGSAVVVTTYESAADRLDAIQPAAFDMLILDEAHKLRNLHGANKPPKVATTVRDALKKRLFKFVVMLTATPIQNRIWDLYSLLDYLTVARGHQNPLGTPEEFKKRYLKPSTDGRQLLPHNEEPFRRILRQYLVRTRRGDARLLFPKREVQTSTVNLSHPEKQLLSLVSRHIGGLNAFQQTSLAQAMMSSPQALAAQLENMSERNPSLRLAAQQSRMLADSCAEPAKLQRLLFLCEEMRAKLPNDWRVVVFTRRKETQSTIGHALERRRIPVGFICGGEARRNQMALEGLWAKPPGINVLVSTDAGAEGINLQVANVLVNYDLPWNPMVVEQRIGRLQRLASEHGHVVIYNLVAAGSVEERVVARLMEKLQGIAQAIGDIESILESPQWNGDVDRFQDQIRELVVKSLLGQDVERAAQLAKESVERAMQQLEEQKAEMDRTLGQLDEMHRTGPRMPRLERTAPTMQSQDFVLRSRRVDGGTIVETSPGVFEVRIPGRPHEVITFDEKTEKAISAHVVFMGKVKLFQPGKAEFERLVQHWVDRCGQYICDLRQRTEADAERLARSWCEKVPETRFLGSQITEREAKFQGRTRIKVKASNGMDAYEKLISGKFHPEGHQVVQTTANRSDFVIEKVLPSEILPDYSEPLAKAVETDPDIGEFCRFYEARREEELAGAGSDMRLQHKIREDFTPAVVGDIVGLQGVRYEEVRLQVRFMLQGRGNYEVVLQAVPASGQVLEEPQRKHCEHTGLRVPVECLEQCQLTGKLVLKHLLVTSEVSRRRALQDQAVTCQVTGKTVLSDEVARSAVSGTVGIKSAFVSCQETRALLLPSETGKSAVSGKVVRQDLLLPSEKPPHRLGLADEFDTCQVTEKRLLVDELGQSALSGKVVDRDLLLPSACSGQLALEEEMVVCQESGVWLLPEETETCVLTGKRVDTRRLARSELSGAWALSPLLVRCDVTDKRVLPSELEKCELTGSLALSSELATCTVTGKRALRSRMLICQQTQEWVLVEHTAKSDYSGMMVKQSLLLPSERPPGRRGLLSEFGVCSVTGKHLLLDELERSSASGKLADKDLLRPSDRSGALALPEELITCAESQTQLLPEETGRCEVTGLTVDSRLLSRSEASGTRALTRLMDRCGATHKLCLATELIPCELTRTRVLPEQLDVCSVTGKRVLKSRLVLCGKTRHPVLVTETSRSSLSGLVVRKDLLFPSEKPPHRLGLSEEMAVCQVTTRRLLLDEMNNSAVSGKRVDRDLLVPSDRSGAVALPDEMVVCGETGARLLPAEVGYCSVTRKRVDARLLSTSEHSGRVALTRLTRRCAVTNRLALAEELEQCSLTRDWALPCELETCAVTGKRGICGEMLRSDVSGKYVVPQKAIRSAISGKIGLPEEVVRCAWLEQPILREEAKACTLTNRLVAGKFLNKDDELIPLRQLLDGKCREAVPADTLLTKIRQLDESYCRGITQVWMVRSPNGGKLAICGEIRSWFGMKVRYIGFLLKDAEEFEITGKGVLGYRGRHGWEEEEELESS